MSSIRPVADSTPLVASGWPRSIVRVVKYHSLYLQPHQASTYSLNWSINKIPLPLHAAMASLAENTLCKSRSRRSGTRDLAGKSQSVDDQDSKRPLRERLPKGSFDLDGKLTNEGYDTLNRMVAFGVSIGMPLQTLPV